jgi:hypothetical protein
MTVSTRTLLFALLLLGLSTMVVDGQALRGRLSVQMSANSVLQTAGPGAQLRVHLPLLSNVAIGAEAGFSTYVLEGRRRGTYAFNPSGTLRLALPSRSLGTTMLLLGGGYHVPFGHKAVQSGPTLHAGIGRMWTLEETTLSFEVTPTAFVRPQRVSFLMPVRLGVIF